MNAVVRLLGAPSVETGGAPVPAPRGRKSWALLAYVLLAERPPSRQRLAALLFPDAEDPLGALRWSLADLRRTLSSYAEIGGDPVAIRLSDDATTDIEMLEHGITEPLDSLGGELLEGLTLEGCPAFETWLQVERHRLASAGEALLRELALRELSAGRPDAAVGVATALVGRNPLDETNQVLLVRCLAAAGSHQAAADQVRRCEELFGTELGTAPSPALRAAADARPMASMQQLTHGSAAAAAQLEAGQAAVNAGAI